MIQEYDFTAKLNNIDNQRERVDIMNAFAWRIRRSNPSETLRIAAETHEISTDIDYKEGIASSFKNSGTAFYLLSLYESGIIDLNKAREMFFGLGDKQAESDCIRNLGNIYHSIGEFEKSIEYYEKAKEISTVLGDEKGIAYNLGNIGYVLYLRKDYEEAHYYLYRTHAILDKLNDILGLADVLNNMGKNHLALHELGKAFTCFEESLKLSQRIDHLRGVANALRNLGTYYEYKDDNEQALNFFIDALKVAEEVGERALIADVSLNLSVIFEKIHLFEQALYYHKKHGALKTEILENSNKNAINAVQIQFDLEQVEREKEIFKIRNDELACFQKELEEKNIKLELLSLVASQSDNVIIITDATGVLNFVNDSFVRFNAATFEELKITRGDTIFDISNNPNIRELVDDCIRNKKSVTYEVLNISQAGEQVWGSALLTPVFNQSGELTNLIIIETDVTERKKTEAIIAEKNKDITASITYGKRIQEAMLPDKSKIGREFADYFVYNQPKDIVSGDFYWFDKVGDHVVFAVADCTGHGVPGAFMSVIGIDLLNQIVNDSSITTPASVLEQLDIKIKKVLKQNGEENETTDGMDIAFCEFCMDCQEEGETIFLNYSGAYRPLWLIRNNEVVEFKPDKFSIGGDVTADKEFMKNSIPTQKGDVFYIFTDGCIDLFGGKKGKKFRADGLKKLLLSIHQLPMDKQESIVQATLKNWQGELDQVDDILIMGFKIQ